MEMLERSPKIFLAVWIDDVLKHYLINRIRASTVFDIDDFQCGEISVLVLKDDNVSLFSGSAAGRKIITRGICNIRNSRNASYQGDAIDGWWIAINVNCGVTSL